MAFELVTFADIKALLTLTDDELTDYPALGVIKSSMLYAFEEYTGRLFELVSRTVTVFVTQQPRSMFYLEAIPVTAMTSVTLTQAGSDESFTENENYEVTEYGIRLYGRVKNTKVTIVYTGGLANVAALPALNRAALYQVSYEFQGKDWIGADSVSAEGGNVTKPSLQLLPETKRLLRAAWHPLRTGKP